MSQYLHPDNQEMLWNVFQKMSIAQSIPERQKEILFKQAIGSLYEPNQIYSKTGLQEINKNTILTLKQYCLQNKPEQEEPQPQPQPQVFESPQEKMARQFQEKQKEYEELTAKPNLPKPSELFQDKQTDDGVITNMDELLKQYQEQRDMDLEKGTEKEKEKGKVDIWEYVRALENRLLLLSEEVKELRSNANRI